MHSDSNIYQTSQQNSYRGDQSEKKSLKDIMFCASGQKNKELVRSNHLSGSKSLGPKKINYSSEKQLIGSKYHQPDDSSIYQSTEKQCKQDLSKRFSHAQVDFQNVNNLFCSFSQQQYQESGQNSFEYDKKSIIQSESQKTLHSTLEMESIKQTNLQQKMKIDQLEQKLQNQQINLGQKDQQIHQMGNQIVKLQNTISELCDKLKFQEEQLNQQEISESNVIRTKDKEINQLKNLMQDIQSENKTLIGRQNDSQSQMTDKIKKYNFLNEENLKLLGECKFKDKQLDDQIKINKILELELQKISAMITRNEQNLDKFYKIAQQREIEFQLKEQEFQILIKERKHESVRMNTEVQTDTEINNSFQSAFLNPAILTMNDPARTSISGLLENLSSELQETLWQKKFQLEMDNLNLTKQQLEKREKILQFKEEKIQNFYKQLSEQYNISL